MKKTMILALVMIGCVLTAMAQNVAVLHMKDGTTRRFTNGVKEKTMMEFFEYVPHDNLPSATNTTEHANGYTCQWDVTQATHEGGKYSVTIIWEDLLPEGFQPRYGLCFGTQPGITVDHCDKVQYCYQNVDYLVEHPDFHFIFIGQRNPNLQWTDSNGQEQRLYIPDVEFWFDYIDTELQPGQTYYYRTFAEGQADDNGELKTTNMYGPEKSFRVPRVMADFGYGSTPIPSDEAVAAFASHFPEGVTAPTWQELETLWYLWRASGEGMKVDLTAETTTEQFDDGTGYQLNRIPDEFYTWMTQREVVIDAFDGLEGIKYYYNGGDTIFYATAERITGVDSIPGGKYMRFTPVENYNPFVTYHSSEVVPGVKYKFVVNFAPETLPTATANDSLPTHLRITNVSNKKTIVGNPIVPATQMSTYENNDFSTNVMGVRLEIETRVTNSEVKNNLYNRIMRIAEMRLTPIKEEE